MSFLAPIVGFVTSAIGSLGIVGRALIGIGINLVVGKLQQNQAKKNSNAVGGVEFERDYGENVSRKVLCGLVGLPGHDCYVNTYGSSNKFLQQIYVLSDFPCDGLSRIWAGGTLLVLNLVSDDGVKAVYSVASGDYGGSMTFTFYRGTQSAADATLIANANPTGRWTENHLGTGICYLIAQLTYDQDKLNSFPDFFFEIRGARLYDIRKDSTVGGSGPHRWGNYATYEFSENPVVQEYNYRRGFAINDDMFCGMGMEAVDLPFDQYVTAANICDEVFQGQPRYRCSIILDTDQDHGDNIDALMTSCGGMVIDSVEGSWPLIGTDQPIVETFTDDDLVVGETVRFQRRRSMADLVNAVSGTYPEPDNIWSPAGYDTQTNAAYVGLDRRTRDVSLDLPTVRSKQQANNLASLYFNENRFEATADVVLRPRFQTLKAGSWVRWNSKRYGDFTFMATARSIRALTSDGPRNVALSLQQRDGSIYQSVGVIAPVIPMPNADPVYLNELQDWTIIPVLSVGADGRTYPAFRMSWSPIDDTTVTGALFEYWVKTAPQNVFTRQVDASQTILFIQEGILSLTEYQFRHKLIANRVTNWTADRTVKSLDGGNSDFEVGMADLNKDVTDRFSELQREMDDFFRPMLLDLMTSFSLEGAVGEVRRQQIVAQMGDAMAQIVEERRVRVSQDEALAQVITALTTTVSNNLARLQTEETTRATGDSALSQRITLLDGTVGQNTAALQTEQTARVNGDNSLAQSITGVNVALNDRTAQGLVSLVAAANQNGVNARFSIAIRTSTGVAFKESGLYLEIYTENGVQKSRIAMMADQVIFTNGVQTQSPFVFEGGVLKLVAARIGTVVIDRIISANNKLDIDGINGTITVYS